MMSIFQWNYFSYNIGMSDLLILNLDAEIEYVYKISEIFRSNGINTTVLDLTDENISGCIYCGKCIKRNYCVNDEMINELGDAIRSCDALMIAADVIYGNISEKCENVMSKLVHSSGNYLSHKIVVPLLDSRMEDYENAAKTILHYAEETGSIVLTSWLQAEVHHPDYLHYAEDELLWILSSLDKKDRPSSQYPRNLHFTR